MGRTPRATASTINDHGFVVSHPERTGLLQVDPRHHTRMSVEPDACTGGYRRGYHLLVDGCHVGRLTLLPRTPAATSAHALVTAARRHLNDCLAIVGGDAQAAIDLFAATGVDGHGFVVSTPEFIRTPACRPDTAAGARNGNRLRQLDHHHPQGLQLHGDVSYDI